MKANERIKKAEAMLKRTATTRTTFPPVDKIPDRGLIKNLINFKSPEIEVKNNLCRIDSLNSFKVLLKNPNSEIYLLGDNKLHLLLCITEETEGKYTVSFISSNVSQNSLFGISEEVQEEENFSEFDKYKRLVGGMTNYGYASTVKMKDGKIKTFN